MCDTLVALPDATISGSTLFAKNSDRDPNEAQYIEMVASQDHQAGENLSCTYITIPQVEHTYAVLLSKPFWIWGAEMGANDQGVVIGNEAVFTRIPHEKEPGLIGMDLLRLGLERGKTALEALRVITGLLKEYGQAGNCGFAHPFFYHNSFLIADRKEAWVLETAGREWAAQKVERVRSISNAITIGSDFDMASDDLVKIAVDKGWCSSEKNFDFGKCYSDMIFTTFSASRSRQMCSSELLLQQQGKISAADMMEMLQHHTPDPDGKWRPDKAVTGADVCMHFGYGPIRINQTTGSMVTELGQDQTTHWLTGTAAPCTSLFKPIWMDSGLNIPGNTPGGTCDESSIWWQHEILHRQIVRDYQKRKAIIDTDRKTIQKEFIDQAAEYRLRPARERAELSRQCFERSTRARDEWLNKVANHPIGKQARFYYLRAWSEINKQAKISESLISK